MATVLVVVVMDDWAEVRVHREVIAELLLAFVGWDLVHDEGERVFIQPLRNRLYTESRLFFQIEVIYGTAMSQRFGADFLELKIALFRSMPSPMRAHGCHQFLALLDIYLPNDCFGIVCQTRLAISSLSNNVFFAWFNLNFWDLPRRVFGFGLCHILFSLSFGTLLFELDEILGNHDGSFLGSLVPRRLQTRLSLIQVNWFEVSTLQLRLNGNCRQLLVQLDIGVHHILFVFAL